MQGTQYATKRSILCRGAFCRPTHRTYDSETPIFYFYLFIFLCVRIKTRNSAEIMSYNVPDMI